MLLCNLAFGGDGKDQSNNCVKTLKPYGKSEWCASEERKGCTKLHADEWCDASVAAEAERNLSEKRLNLVYKKAIKSLDDKPKESLKASQRAWLKFRELNCLARYDTIAGGDEVMRNNIWQDCIDELNKERTVELKKEFCQNEKGCE